MAGGFEWTPRPVEKSYMWRDLRPAFNGASAHSGSKINNFVFGRCSTAQFVHYLGRSTMQSSDQRRETIMTIQRALITTLLGALALFGMLSQAALAGPVVGPCDAGTNVTNTPGFVYLPINGFGQTYCQTTFGWSDTWIATSQPATYDQHLDVLSGDNAPSLFYTANGVTVGTGNIYNLISPFLDAAAANSVIGQPVPGGNPNVLVVSQLQVAGNQ